ncbi:MAG TPA: hypothetical protein VGZ52_07790 [Acidimicrobiales bacterium]|jgi:hypothetical protein|nr:hypothetical protein [Acidimicrobiales bacterium]
MRLEDLILRIPGDEFHVRFHEQLTVLCGIGMLERQALADSMVGALTGNVENTVLTLRDRTGRPMEVVSVGGTAACRYVDDDTPALPFVGTIAPTADALRALMLVQAGDLGLTPSRDHADEHPELVEARATLQELARQLDVAKSGRTQKEQLRDELAAISAQIRQAEDGTARREYAGVLSELERVRAESAALQSGDTGAETDQHLLDSAEEARDLAGRWKSAAGRVTRLTVQAPAMRMDAEDVAVVRWFPEAPPSKLHAMLEELAEARRERDRLDTRLRDTATSKLPEPSDPRIVDLATVDQVTLWRLAAEVSETGRALSREQVAMGGVASVPNHPQPVDGSTLDVIARIEETHRVVEDLEAVADRRRVPAIAAAGIVAVSSIVFAPVSPFVALGLLATSSVGAYLGVGRPMRQLASARKVESHALAAVDAPTYLGFHIRRVEASMTPGAHGRLEEVSARHEAALAHWHELAGTISVDAARVVESEVRAYASALHQLGNATGELETLRLELASRVEPALAQARSAIAEACAAYGIDDVAVESADPARLERLVLEQVELGSAARAQEELEDAEADEEKLANRLDDLLHQLCFRDGTLDARAGALDWAVERAAERQDARRRARSRHDVEQDLERLQTEVRRLRRPEWATVQASEADGPDPEALIARQAELRQRLEAGTEEVIDVERLKDRHAAMERRVASLETQIDADHPETTIAQVADVQQYLVAHLTKAAHCGMNDETVPVVLDEPFLRIAAERKWELLDMLRRLGENTQLIYLTDDPFVGAWARRRASAGLITLLEPVDA